MDDKDRARGQRIEKLRDSVEMWLGAGDPSVAPGAMIETAFLMACADGQLTEPEHAQLAATIESLTGQRYQPEQIRTMLEQLLDTLETDGWAVRIRSVADALQDPGARRNAYRLAAGVSFIDGEIQQAEERLFALLAQAFEIPQDEAGVILADVRDELYTDAVL